MLKHEELLVNEILDKLNIESQGFKAIFNIEIANNQTACSAEIFVQQGIEYNDIQKNISDKKWFDFLQSISNLLIRIYKNHQKFTYLTISYSADNNYKINYEANDSISISNRFVLWEYDEFNIGDRNIPIYKRILDEYRPLK